MHFRNKGMISTTIDNKEIVKLQTELFLLRNKAGRNFNQRVTARFGKRGASKILKDNIRQDHTIKASKVYDKITAKPTGRNFTGGVYVHARSRQKGIEQFKTSPRRTTPSRKIGTLQAETQKGRRVGIPKVFTGRLKQQDQKVFYKRVGKKRFDFARVVGPSLFVMYKRNEKAIKQNFEQGFIKEAIDSIEAAKRRMRK